MVSAFSSGVDLLDLEQRYRRLVVEQFDRLTFKGIARSGKALSLPLEDIYVELKAVADVPDAADTYSATERRLLLEAEARGLSEGDVRRQLDGLRVERWREESRSGSKRLVRRSIEEAIENPANPGLVILGDPGSGKTTLLHWLALREAKNLVGERPPRLPIFVPLAAYDEWLRRTRGPISLLDFLAIYHDKWRCLPGLDPLFRAALDAGRALVLLDGLDEALDVTSRRHIAAQAQALIRSETPRGNRFVLTSRFVGYREAPLPDLPQVSVVDFGEAEIANFAHRWCEACEVWLAGGRRTDEVLRKAAQEEKDLLAEVRANPSVLRLSANPLLLTMLSLLRRQGGKLPDERIRLYGQYIDMLLDNNWEDARSDGARTQSPVRLDRNQATSHLIELSLWLQRYKPSGTARRAELEAALVEIALREDGLDPASASAKERQQAHERAARFLQEMRHFAGVIAERGQDAFGFLHLTFQEYFVGRALARMEPEARWSVLKENSHRPRWREPILLCAGQLGIVEGRTKAVSELGRRVLSAGSPHEEMLHRDVFLVAAMAADGVGFDRALLDELAETLIKLSADSVPAVRKEALRGLAQMMRQGHAGARAWFEERVRQKGRPGETLNALEGILSAEIGAGVREELCGWLRGPNTAYWALAIQALAPLAMHDEVARRHIIDKTGASEHSTKTAAIRALGPLASSVQEVRELLVRKVDDPDEWVRSIAIEALKASATTDATLRPILVAKLDDPDEWVRSEAIVALEGLVPHDAAIRDTVLAKLDDDHGSFVVARVVRALGALVARDSDARRLVLAKLDHPLTIVRSSAISALAAQIPVDAEVRRLVLAKLDDRDSLVRRRACIALQPVVSTDTAVRKHVLEGLGHKPHSVVCEAMDSVKGLLPNDVVVRDFVISKLSDPDSNVRAAAVDMLSMLLPRDRSIREIVLGMLDDRAPDVVAAAVHVLGVLLPHDDAEVRALIHDKLTAPDWMVKASAIGALAPMLPNDAEVREIVVARLVDPDEWIQAHAVRALGALVVGDAEVRRLVAARLEHRSEHVAAAAVDALSRLLPNAPDVRHRFRARLRASTGWMKYASSQSLGAFVSCDDDIRRQIIEMVQASGYWLHPNAIRALESLVPGDAEICRVVLPRLDDPRFGTRCAAVGVVAPLVAQDAGLSRRLLDWIGVSDEQDLQTARWTRRKLASAYATMLPANPTLLARFAAMLQSPAWPVRQGGAWALIRMPGGPPAELLPTLRNLLHDLRAEETWPERIAAAALLVNERDHDLSQRAISTLMTALDHAMDPWYNCPTSGAHIRAEAAKVLSTVAPIYCDEKNFARLTRTLLEDPSESARDAAYQALLRLAVAPEAEHDLDAPAAVSPNPSPNPSSTTIPPLPAAAILHLSDLHFGTLENAALWYSQIAEDLRAELDCKKLDAIILSGDIANVSSPDEYAAARSFLEKLRAEFHLSPQQVIAVPGNHDLHWGLSEEAYEPTRKSKLKRLPPEGTFIERDGGLVEIRDDSLYPQRFQHFAAFYEAVHGAPYPLDPAQQAILYPLPAPKILVLGLNSAWNLDHHFRTRASIHPQALARALDAIRADPAHRDFLKIAVWHHPIHGAFEDHLQDHGFLERLAAADFRIALHGHIHKVNNGIYRYDQSTGGRRLEICCAGTFGAPTHELVPGYPFQYQLLRFEGHTLTVETRRREEVHGTWKPDARFPIGRGKDPAPRYSVML